MALPVVLTFAAPNEIVNPALVACWPNARVGAPSNVSSAPVAVAVTGEPVVAAPNAVIAAPLADRLRLTRAGLNVPALGRPTPLLVKPEAEAVNARGLLGTPNLASVIAGAARFSTKPVGMPNAETTRLVAGLYCRASGVPSAPVTNPDVSGVVDSLLPLIAATFMPE